jgi:hypothetical protein
MSLVPGGEFVGITAGSKAITDKNEVLTIIGFSSVWNNNT